VKALEVFASLLVIRGPARPGVPILLAARSNLTTVIAFTFREAASVNRGFTFELFARLLYPYKRRLPNDTYTVCYPQRNTMLHNFCWVTACWACVCGDRIHSSKLNSWKSVGVFPVPRINRSTAAYKTAACFLELDQASFKGFPRKVMAAS